MRLALTLAALAEFAPHHSVSISTRALSKAANLSESALPTALTALADRNLITIRHGAANRRNAYQVNFLSTVPASFAEAPPAQGASFAEAPLPLFERHPASFAEAPPTENKALAPAAAPLDVFRLSDEILDRVMIRAKITNFDRPTIQLFRGSLHSYMAKFGTDETGRRYVDTGAVPHPPDDEVLARFLAVAEPYRLMPLLETLILEAKQAEARSSGRGTPYNTRRYSWFVYTALQRIHGIHWAETQKAQAQLRLHKRGQRPAPPPAAEQSGLDFAGDTLRAAIGGVKNLR